MKSNTHTHVNYKEIIAKATPKKKITLKQIFHDIKIKLKPKKKK